MSDDTSTTTSPTPADEWSTVSEAREPEIKLTFDVIGEVFIGEYLGTRTQPGNDGNYVQYRFRGEDGDVYFLNPLANIREAFESGKIRAGSRVRITYVDDQDTGQRSPMKIFKVDVAKRTR